MTKYMTPITFVGGPRDQEADVFEWGKMPSDLHYAGGVYRARRLVDTRRFVYLWVPA